ncbi:MAG: VanZ family protein [Clostridia bacterium]|nr:VanZ family protein [Clostridia bacterium]
MKKVVRPILWALFVIYCVILIYILFLSRGSLAHYSYDRYFRQFTNFIPFKTIVEYIQRYRDGFQNLSVTNLLGNFVLFLPMSMALPCLFKKLDRFWKVTLCILGMVVLVEAAQGLLRVGSIDIDDVIFNVCGAMIGYGIIKIPFINKLLTKIDLIHPTGK